MQVVCYNYGESSCAWGNQDSGEILWCVSTSTSFLLHSTVQMPGTQPDDTQECTRLHAHHAACETCCVCFSTAKALCSKNHLLCVLLNCKGAVLKESSAVCASQLQRRCAQRIICCVCFSTAKALCSKNHLPCVLLNCKGAVLKESSAVCASQLQRRCAQRIICCVCFSTAKALCSKNHLAVSMCVGSLAFPLNFVSHHPPSFMLLTKLIIEIKTCW